MVHKDQSSHIYVSSLLSLFWHKKKRINSVSVTASRYVSEALLTNFYQNRNLIKTNEKTTCGYYTTYKLFLQPFKNNISIGIVFSYFLLIILHQL